MLPQVSTTQSSLLWAPANPWTREYLDRELATMQWLAPFDDGKILLESRHTPGVGIAHCYLRDDMMEWGPYPWLGERVDGNPARVWMSITPMEIESHYMPISLAHGRVGIGGLGLGYAVQRILSKPEVTEVVAYETNPAITALYYRNWGNSKGLTIVQQDVGTLEGESFDLFFNDTYSSVDNPLALDHWATLPLKNQIGVYHWWGFESWLLPLLLTGQPVPRIYHQRYGLYLEQWRQAVVVGRDHGQPGTCSNLDQVLLDIAHLPGAIWTDLL